MTHPPELDIESITYTHKDFDANMFFFYLDRLLDRMSPISSLIGRIPQPRELGALTIFPPELLLTILESLSIIDLMRFRRCNRSSSCFVDTMLRTALSFAPNTVKGIMALQISTHITAQQLCRKLCQSYCDGCGELAQYIYLPTCSRACFACIHPGGSRWFYCSYPEERVIKKYGLGPEDRAALPSFRSLPATFTNGMNKFKVGGRHTLYDGIATSQMVSDRPELWRTVLDDDYLNRREAQEDRAWAMWKRDPNRDDITVVRDPLPRCLRMHMSVVFAPWLDSAASRAMQGVFCTSCLHTKRQDKLYTREMFLEHLRDCRVGPDDSFQRTRRFHDRIELSLIEDVE